MHSSEMQTPRLGMVGLQSRHDFLAAVEPRRPSSPSEPVPSKKRPGSHLGFIPQRLVNHLDTATALGRLADLEVTPEFAPSVSDDTCRSNRSRRFSFSLGHLLRKRARV